MELGLNWENLTWFEETASMSVAQEESLEAVIPEYCPDIARMVDAVGQISLREKKLFGERLTVNGTVKVRVFYTSEENAGLRSLTVAVPFSCQLDDKRLTPCGTVEIHNRLLLCEVKAVTARKVYVRVMPELSIIGYQTKNCRVCTQATEGIQTHWEDWEAELLTGVTEREFSYTQEAMMDGSQPMPEELLSDHLYFRVVECRHIGSKLVIKGEASVSILYRSEGQQLCAYETVLPFSQILDGIEVSEEALFDVQPQLPESDLRLIRTEDGSGIGVTARVILLVFVREKQKMHYIADLYSTAYQTDLESSVCQVTTAYRREVLRQNAVQKMEFGQAAPFCYLTQADCGQITVGVEDEKTALRTNVRMKILYVDESGAPMSTERSMEIAVPAAAMPENYCPICGQSSQRISGGSCELDLPIDILLSHSSKKEITAITGGSLSEDAIAEIQPSVVLRRREPGETLWDIAKQYRTDEGLLRSINELTDESAGEMLLIPKMR